MEIRYVCYDCSQELNLFGFRAVNEVGRKSCNKCGYNGDYLLVIGEDEYDIASKALKREVKENGNKKSGVGN